MRVCFHTKADVDPYLLVAKVIRTVEATPPSLELRRGRKVVVGKGIIERVQNFTRAGVIAEVASGKTEDRKEYKLETMRMTQVLVFLPSVRGGAFESVMVLLESLYGHRQKRDALVLDVDKCEQAFTSQPKIFERTWPQTQEKKMERTYLQQLSGHFDTRAKAILVEAPMEICAGVPDVAAALVVLPNLALRGQRGQIHDRVDSPALQDHMLWVLLVKVFFWRIQRDKQHVGLRP